MDLELPDPARVLEQRLAAIRLLRDCAPRPGAIAREARIEVVVDKAGLDVRVITVPANSEVADCVKAEVARHLAQFGAGTWNLRSRHAITIEPRFTVARLTASLELAVPSYVTRCYPATNAPARVTIVASAKVDDPAFTIELDAGDATFKTCVRELLQTYLRTAYGSVRTVGATKEPYFRIDASVSATVTVDVKPPEKR
jgi:hypothetical protein